MIKYLVIWNYPLGNKHELFPYKNSEINSSSNITSLYEISSHFNIVITCQYHYKIKDLSYLFGGS